MLFGVPALVHVAKYKYYFVNQFNQKREETGLQ